MSMPTKLSTLWIFVTLNYLYCDVTGLMDPDVLKQYLAGIPRWPADDPGILARNRNLRGDQDLHGPPVPATGAPREPLGEHRSGRIHDSRDGGDLALRIWVDRLLRLFLRHRGDDYRVH